MSLRHKHFLVKLLSRWVWYHTFAFLPGFFLLSFDSLTQLLEACVKNCGKPLHQELGKFRFLNELIRMISPKVRVVSVTFEVIVLDVHFCVPGFFLSCLLPLFMFLLCVNWQYLANEISENTKKKVKELLYSWKTGLPHEPKIAEAYEMLKKQGERDCTDSFHFDG